MKPIRIPTVNSGQIDASERLYRATREARLRTTRAQKMVLLLAAEQRPSAARGSPRSFSRKRGDAARRWLERYP